VYPIGSKEVDILLVYQGSKKYFLRAKTPFKRVRWLQALNYYTQNLTEDLRITAYPEIKGKIFKKGLRI